MIEKFPFAELSPPTASASSKIHSASLTSPRTAESFTLLTLSCYERLRLALSTSRLAGMAKSKSCSSESSPPTTRATSLSSMKSHFARVLSSKRTARTRAAMDPKTDDASGGRPTRRHRIRRPTQSSRLARLTSPHAATKSAIHWRNSVDE